MVICLRMGKTYTAKTPSGDFKVTTSENPLLSQQAVTSKGIPVPSTNLQLNHYPNTQLDLFCCDNLSFSMQASSTWLTNCVDFNMRLQSPTREGCWLQSSSVHHTMKIKKSPWLQNLMVYKHGSFFTRKMNYGKFCLQSQFSWTKLCSTLVQLVSPIIALKIIFLYV